jgi:4'-phosphopantetheinyl transferase EntD
LAVAKETGAKVPINPQFSAVIGRRAPNPATPSPIIAGLFPEGVAAAELRVPGALSLLDPAEAAAVAKAVPKRASEFAAGRLCARRVLAEFGVEGFAVLAASDRRPVWPESLVGSITHTAGFCAAVAAQCRHFSSLGLDTETAGAVKAELWPRICTDWEMAWVGSLAPAAQADAVTLIFSAKEAFFKCQYPLTRERLEFADLKVEPVAWGASCGPLIVTPTRPIGLAARSAALECAFRFHEQFVSTGISLRSP